MGHKIAGDVYDKRPVGRPKEGMQSRSIERKIRLEPYLDEELGYMCRTMGISRSEAIRQGIQLFLKAARQIVFRHEGG